VSLTLREGEILGIAGLIGAGRTETLRAFFGLDRIRSGRVLVFARESTSCAPARRLREGIGLLSENRKEEGLMLNRTLADNLTITRYGPMSKLGFISNRRQRRCAGDWMARLDVRAQSPARRSMNCPAGTSKRSPSDGCCTTTPKSCCSTNQRAASMSAAKVQIYKLLGDCRRRQIDPLRQFLPARIAGCVRHHRRDVPRHALGHSSRQ